MHTTRQRLVLVLDDEQLSYELFECDARSGDEQARDSLLGKLAGDLIVLIPGHGQTADSALSLIRLLASQSQSRLVWSIDIDPPKGGDPTKARALPVIVRSRLLRMFPSSAQNEDRAPHTAVTLVGWSHGGAEALRSAQVDPQLIPRVVGLCPTGLIRRSPLELLASFWVECVHIALVALLSGSLPYIKRVLRIGANIVAGVLGDIRRSHSPLRAWNDISWAARRVSGADYRYAGSVVLLFGRSDKVIRWRNVFPGCKHADEISRYTPLLQPLEFPSVRQLQVQALEGNHLSPETDPAFGITALRCAGQLKEA